jgi:hypothetical protein
LQITEEFSKAVANVRTGIISALGRDLLEISERYKKEYLTPLIEEEKSKRASQHRAEASVITRDIEKIEQRTKALSELLRGSTQSLRKWISDAEGVLAEARKQTVSRNG